MHITFLSQIIGALIALTTIRMYTDLLSPEQLGAAMLALGTIALLDGVFSSSINQVIFYYGSKQNLKSYLYLILLKYKKISIFYGGALIFLIVLLIFISPKIIAHTWIAILLLVICYVVIEPSRSSLFSFLNVISDRKKYGLQVVIDSVLTLVMTFCLLSYTPNWIFLILGILAARFIALFTNDYLLKTSWVKEEQPTLDNKSNLIKRDEIFRHMKPIMLMGGIGWVSSFADRFIIAAMLNIRDTGYYSIATGLVNKPYTIASDSFTAYFRPLLYKAFANQNLNKFKKTLTYWLLSAAPVGIAGMILFYILKEPIVNLLLAEQYRGRIEEILWILAAAMTLTILTHSIDNIFLARGQGNKLYKLQLFLLPVHLIVIGLGAFYFGVIGAVCGKFTSELIKFISTLLYSKRFEL